MNMNFIRKLPIPLEVKQQFPLTPELAEIKAKRDSELRDIFTSKSDKFLLIIGPCSADNEEAVMDYLQRLRKIQEQVSEKIFILPRLYTSKPRSTGEGYMGFVHQPDPNAKPDIFKGIVAVREFHTRALKETGFSCADEMLYPENHRYLSDLLSYVAVGARSVEDQQHRLTASGLLIPVGMKNPTGGNLYSMMNAIASAQKPHTFIYRGWEVESEGNPLSHAILRGYIDENGNYRKNCGYSDLEKLFELYSEASLRNPAAIVDVSHANSAKQYLEQIPNALDVLESRRRNSDIKHLVKGLMIESYIEDGAQDPGGGTYGMSITDPCLGFEKSEKLIYEIAEKL